MFVLLATCTYSLGQKIEYPPGYAEEANWTVKLTAPYLGQVHDGLPITSRKAMEPILKEEATYNRLLQFGRSAIEFNSIHPDRPIMHEANALRALAWTGTDEAVKVLASILTQQPSELQESVVRWLGETHNSNAVPYLVAVMHDDL